MFRCQRKCHRFDPDILLQILMYRIYYTDPKAMHLARWQDVSALTNALECCDYLRKQGMQYVVMVSDYADMVGSPGVRGAGTEYVPQLKN